MSSRNVLDPERPKTDRRRRTRKNVVQEQYWREMRIEAAIIKTIYDPMEKLSQKELARISSGLYDNMGANTVYSMNKHKRWEITPYALVRNIKNPDATVLVLDRKGTHKCTYFYTRHTEDNIRMALSCDQNGNLVKKTSARMGTKLKNLLTDHRTHDKSKDCECCRSYNEDPRVEYRMCSPHENQWITTGNVTGGGYSAWDPYVRCHFKREYLEDRGNLDLEEESDFDESDLEEETDSYRKRRFCLGDFIVEKPLNIKEWVIVP